MARRYSRFPMLKKRKGTDGKVWFYCRKVIPANLRGMFGGRWQIMESLHTTDESEAKVRLLRLAHETERDLQRARDRYREAVANPETLAKEWRKGLFREDQEDRVNRARTERSLEAEIHALEDAIEDHREALQLGNVKPVQGILREVLDGYHITLSPPDERKLAHALLHERMTALEIALQRALGQWRDEPVTKPPPLVLNVMGAWLKERKPPSKTAHEVRATFNRFLAELPDGDKPIAEVSKDDVRAFRTALLGDSAKVGKGKGSLAPVTVRKYMNLFGTVLRHAVRTGLIDKSPAEGIGRGCPLAPPPWEAGMLPRAVRASLRLQGATLTPLACGEGGALGASLSLVLAQALTSGSTLPAAST